MSPGAELHLRISSDPADLPPLRAQVRDWLQAHRWSDVQAGELVLALDEAVSNVIRHGYGNQGGMPIEVCLLPAVDADGEEGLEVQIRDFGQQVDPAQIRGRDLDDIRPGGLGVHIIRAMMNSLEYRPAPGGGMLAIMRKSRGHTVAAGRCT